MFFNTYYTLPSSTDLDNLKTKLVGKTLDVKNKKYIILDRGATINIYPYADPKEKVKTLPLGEIYTRKSGKTYLKMWPRLTDVGIPFMIILFSMFAILCSLVSLFLFGIKSYVIPLNILVWAVVAQIILWIVMQFGYYSYVRVIKSQVMNLTKTS